ncbi:MAG: LPXTG cell wall anchor domain-containing protein [Akkermansiaceae bacterium]|nr:LPXTG cell wall anchor domain-containing protein [Armatimonadota bacterium]
MSSAIPVPRCSGGREPRGVLSGTDCGGTCRSWRPFAGRSYFNVRTVQFGGGQSVFVPSPGTNTLIGSVLLVLAGGLIRKRRRNESR